MTTPPISAPASDPARAGDPGDLGLPAGYRGERTSAGWYAERLEWSARLAEAGFGPATDGALVASAATGRAPLAELRAGGETLLVRRFTHGGLLRALTGRRFLDPARPFRELAVAARLQSLSIATPDVVAARARPAIGGGWRLDLVTRRVPDAIDLGHVLAEARVENVERARLRPLFAALGALVRRMHAARFVHADLTPNNVLVNRAALAGAEPELWILDLDRGRFVDVLGEEERLDNLRRLFRFVARREERGRLLARTDFARFFLGDDSGGGYDPGGTRWKDDWRAVHARHRRASVWHRAGWWLERAWSRAPDPREDAARSRRA